MITLFFALNALFWGLMDHGMHCRLAARLGAKRCPPHMIHLLMGAVCFVIAVVAAQWTYLRNMV